ncbi:signal peptidase I [Amycolatopsis circi]|uniref:signal peptidase I n=1 Tax=Amycolatopsis circi TaxID=871959 RepID=UPI000E26C123|nr:signal peptidase I [Amycolatopsis circi]
MTEGWTSGNANEDAADNRGWLVGHFLDPSHGVRATNDVEVKWANHPAGDKRPEWTADDQRTTLVMLISGEFRIDVTGGAKTMSRQGDYVMWGPGIDHSWEALADSVVLTVRWPSAT